MQTQPSVNRVVGATLLITGCCIGAGMLGMPVLSAVAGFQPSLVMFTLCWLFMAVTGLLLLEVTLWFPKGVNIVTMAEETLGRTGKIVAWSVFLFLFYSLMIAYISAGGALFVEFATDLFGYEIPKWVGSLFLITLFGIVLLMGTWYVDRCNRLLMAGLIIFYLLLVAMGVPHVKTELLSHRDWGLAVLVVPTMIVSFGYHNLVPSIAAYLNDDMRKTRIAIIVGSATPLIIYLAWQYVILGMVPVDGVGGFREALEQGDLATQALRKTVGGTMITNFAELFAFFAIVTSFLGVSLSFVDFLSDGLHVEKKKQGKLLLCLLVLAPPMLLSITYPKLFLTALNYAGGYGAVILFGILPALMLWKGRYVTKREGEQVIGGGKPLLIGVILFAWAVMGAQTWITYHYS